MEGQIYFAKLSNTSCILLTATVLLLSVNFVNTQRLQKRNAYQLCNQISHHTRRPCSDYDNYGCFCGLGQRGSTPEPLDNVDQCCMTHDDCYGTLECNRWYQYPQVLTYTWEWDNETRTSECVDSRDVYPCHRSICECDRLLSECLVSAQYNASMKNVDINNCQDSETSRSGWGWFFSW